MSLMRYNPDKHHRGSIRLHGYNYSFKGLYFITICSYQRQCLFGDIIAGKMQLNSLGQIVADEWIKTVEIRPDFGLDEWVIMPNHLHGIVIINSSDQSDAGADGTGSGGAHGCAPLHGASLPGASLPDASLPDASPGGIACRNPRSISSFVAGFKSAATKQINIQRNAVGTPVWQRNFYEHIIRSEISLKRIQQYIQTNPSTWQNDQLNPANPSKW